MFNVFKKILKNQELTQEDLDKISPFVMCRWLQGNPGSLQIAQFLNMYYKIPIDVQVKVIQSILGGKVRYIQYIKGSKTDDSDLDVISRFFNISRDKALMYSEFITEQDLREMKCKLEKEQLVRK